jgi:dTMP kinase
MENGKYIVIEGGDGTGKSTQAEILVERIKQTGRNATLVEEPGSTDIGYEIRKIVKDGSLKRDPLTNLMLFTAGRIELWKQIIKPSVEAGDWVVSARNWFSTLAYQGYGEKMDLQLITDFTHDYVSEKYANPDLSIVLVHNVPEEIQKRMSERQTDAEVDYFEETGNINKHTVDDSYKKIATSLANYAIEIDGSDIIQIHKKIWKIIEKDFLIE